MTAIKTRTFLSGNSEAVRLPKDVGFGAGTEVVVERDGDVVSIRPARPSLPWLIGQLKTLPAPSGVQAREPFEAPDRTGL